MESSTEPETRKVSQEIGPPVSVSYTSVKLPTFSVSEPLTWFRRAEVQFRLKGIKRSETRADFVLEALPDSVFRKISPWLEEHEEGIPYEKLKTHMLQKFTLSRTERAKKVLDLMNEPLGDRSPREVWDEMQSLLRLTEMDSATGKPLRLDMERHIWLLTLPQSIRSLLDDAENMKMEDLVNKAEALVIASRASVTKPCGGPVSTCELAHAETEVVEMPDTGYNNDVNFCQRTTHPRKNIFHREYKSKGYITSSGLCNYHQKYGTKAWACVDGCNWISKNVQRGRHTEWRPRQIKM